MLESFEELNIGRMAVEEVEPIDKWFDIEKEITQDDINRVMRELEMARRTDPKSRGGHGKWAGFASRALDLKKLGASAEITDEEQKDMLRELEDARRNNDWDWVGSRVVSYNQLGIFVDLQTKDKEGMQHALEKIRTRTNVGPDLQWSDFKHAVFNMRELGIPVELTSEEKQETLRKLDEHKNSIDEYHWYKFASDLIFMKRVGIPFEITADDRQAMLDELKRIRKKGNETTQYVWGSFAQLAVMMDELSQVSSLELSATRMPEQREF